METPGPERPPALDARPAPPTDGPPVSGWVVPGRHDPDGPRSRAFTAVSWLAALVIAGFSAWLSMRAADGSDGYRAGVAVGAFIAPFLISAVLRLIVTRIGWGRFDRAALRSHWVPLGAVLLMVISAVGSLGRLAPATPVDASTAMHIAAPFTLRAADPETVANVERVMREAEIDGTIAVRHVVGEDGSVSLFVAADAGLGEDDLAEVAMGLDSTSEATPTFETIAGEEVALLSESNPAIATWVQAPLLLSVYAGDPATLRAVVEAVIESG